jgi:glycosyltransferase involved in cell wall biosynthesis
VTAAKLLELENIRFNIIGRGQTYQEIMDLAQALKVNNIDFIDYVPMSELKNSLAKADVCLGVFGRTEKAKRVIPNKVYESLAAQRLVLTGESIAIKELLTDGEDAVFCKMADAKDLAEKILSIKNGRIDEVKLATNGYEVYRQFCRPEIIVKKLLDNLLEEGLIS